MRRDIASEPDLNWQMTNVVEDGRFVAFEWTWASTYTGPDPAGKTVTNKKMSGRGESLVEIENGKIKRFTDYYDLASYFR
jgi:predicted ester cyclase